MQKLFYLAAVLLTLAIAVFSQTPTPTPSPKTSDEVVRISTNLVQVDVTVTDKSGKVVRGLKPEDFEIYENGQKEPISNFSFINNARETTAAPEKIE